MNPPIKMKRGTAEEKESNEEDDEENTNEEQDVEAFKHKDNDPKEVKQVKQKNKMTTRKVHPRRMKYKTSLNG